MADFLSALRERVLLFDGAMGTQLMALHLSDDDFGGAAHHGCNEALVLTRPDVIEQIHRDYFAAGADVVETDSFTASRLKLDEYGLGAQTRAINVASAEIARRAADAYSTPQQPRFVAGSLGPTGMLISSSDPALSKVTFDELADLYEEQSSALLETSQDLLEMKAAIAGITRAFDKGVRRVPIQAQATLDVTGRMLLGTDISAVCATLDALPIDVIGLNCSTGPSHMRDPIRYLVENSRCFVSVIPNAGLPRMGPKGETIYPETPEEMARELHAFVTDFGVNAIGGCCGTTPEHIAAFRANIDGLAVSGYVPRIPEPKPLQLAASAMTAVALNQEGTVLLIGERVNSQGSRKIKRLLLADDYDEITLVARSQVEGGAHLLDVCTALTERVDEDVQMATIVKRLAQSVESPLVIDSTEAKVIEAALKIYAGRPVVNSINLENGRTKIDSVMPLVKEAGAAVFALTIDETGMAKTAQQKLEVARRIRDIVVDEYCLPPGALIFDDLTFTLATGDAEYIDSAVETIEGIRLIKRELPGVLTSLGVSNVSFGLKPAARHVLNSVMLHHCVEAGLDMAIVNPAEITPYAEIDQTERDLCDDVVLNRRPDALQRIIEHFEAKVVVPGAAAAQVDDDAEAPVEKRIHNAILRRRKDGLEAKIDEALAKRDPVDVLNNVLLPAMKEVGDKFGAGELILPFVLQSAEVMKKAVAHLEQFLERKEGVSKGIVVLATVFGDVHDIGKNLVGTILSNNGYTVHDIGKQVPVNTILDKAVEVGADAIGLSALLVSTSKQMPALVKEQASRGLTYPVVIGGAAINRDFGRRVAYAADERFFDPGVFYAKDAFEGLDLMDALTSETARTPLVERVHQVEPFEGVLGVEHAGVEEALVGGVRDAAAEVAVDRGPADHDRVRQAARRLFLDQRRHLLRGRDEQRREADRIGTDLDGLVEDRVDRHLFADVVHGVAVVREDRPDQVLADVVHVAEHRGQHDDPFAHAFLAFEELLEVRDRLLHHLGRLQDERQDQLAGAELVADLFHRGQQDVVQHVDRIALGQRLVDLRLDPVLAAAQDRVVNAFLDRRLRVVVDLRGGGAGHHHLRFEVLDDALQRIIEHFEAK